MRKTFHYKFNQTGRIDGITLDITKDITTHHLLQVIANLNRIPQNQICFINAQDELLINYKDDYCFRIGTVQQNTKSAKQKPKRINTDKDDNIYKNLFSKPTKQNLKKNKADYDDNDNDDIFSKIIKPKSKNPKNIITKYYYHICNEDEIFEIELYSDSTVKTMKEYIAEKHIIEDLSAIKIIFKWKELHDDLLLNSLKIGDTELLVYIINKNKDETKYEHKKFPIENKNDINNITILDSDLIHSLRISREINVGGSGKVVEVIKEVKYAMKIMNVGDSSFTSQRNFLHEYEIINSLNHPNIVKTYGIFLSDSKTPMSILLELCPTDLSRQIKNGAPTQSDLVKYIYQLSEAMRYVHFMGLIHRDLKPSNILITNDGLIRVTDFGIAKLMSMEEQSTTLGAGTQKFMAPEILKEEEYNEKADVYSFGVILFFVLSRGSMPKINIIDVGNGKKAKIPSNFTMFAQNLINECWSYDPAKRPSFKMIVEKLVESKFDLLELSSEEINDIQTFVKEHQKRIPIYKY